MTVSELIDKLEKIKDKEQSVYVYSYDDFREPNDVLEHNEEVDGILII